MTSRMWEGEKQDERKEGEKERDDRSPGVWPTVISNQVIGSLDGLADFLPHNPKIFPRNNKQPHRTESSAIDSDDDFLMGARSNDLTDFKLLGMAS